MARTEIRIVDATCDACAEAEQTAQAVDVLRIGHEVYDLCKPHLDKFAGYFADLFKKAHQRQEQTQDTRPACVVTGNIPGYSAAEARAAVEGLGYRITGHVDEHTVRIVCGERPAPHKVRLAEENDTPCLDATRPKAFARSIAAGRLDGDDPLPQVRHKLTAADVANSSH
ncbi:hypothetical protein [Streptomyces uncialis]|uniref:hypothetical protein n=1 Tax=Streptomyces uncialis TaxID=1048205 RepID=UPI00093D4163|nr:hypothetical protein [Streptomyces uncialis]